jgi:hypothetical protein
LNALKNSSHIETPIEFFTASPPMGLLPVKPPKVLLFYAAANRRCRHPTASPPVPPSGGGLPPTGAGGLARSPGGACRFAASSSPSPPPCGSTPRCARSSSACGAPFGIQTDTADPGGQRCGDRSGRKSGTAGNGTGRAADGGGGGGPSATRRNTDPPERGHCCDGTNPGCCETAPGFSGLKTQVSAYDGDAFTHTLLSDPIDTSVSIG